MHQFGGKMRALRKQHRIPQALYAKMMKVSRATLARVEKGAKPCVELVANTADFFDVSIFWLIGRRDSAERSVFLDKDEREVLMLHRTLSADGKRMAVEAMRDLREVERIGQLR